MADERRTKCANQLTDFSKNKKVGTSCLAEATISLCMHRSSIIGGQARQTRGYSGDLSEPTFRHVSTPSIYLDDQSCHTPCVHVLCSSSGAWRPHHQPWPPCRQQDVHVDCGTPRAGPAARLHLPGRDGALWPWEDSWEGSTRQGSRSTLCKLIK